MLKRMNKKGQDLTVGTLILIVLGVIILVLLVLGFTMGWDKVWSYLGFTTSSDIQNKISSCNTAALSTTRDYCLRLDEVKLEDGIKMYITCQYPAVESQLAQRASCDQGDVSLAIANKCKGLIDGLRADANANNKKDCSKLLKVSGYDCKSDLASLPGLTDDTLKNYGSNCK